MRTENNILNIDINMIYPHPDNPRKDLGELDEMVESIKKNGIMQNLTVIPGHYLTDDEYRMLANLYKENPDEEIRLLMNSRWSEEGYTLIIGHRRFASSKIAGLKELPCRIIEGMSKKEQVSTMLEENMQRNDLTIYEQAQGFQLMLDLGETVESIAEKTGFSKATIYHRVNIAKLDQKKLQEKEKDENFQLSLKDLYELEQIKDIKERNKILKEVRNSSELVYRARSAAREEKRKEFIKKITPMLKEAGINKAPKKVENERWSGKWEILKEYCLEKEIPEKISVKAKKADELLYVRWNNDIFIIRKKQTTKTQTEADLQRKEQDRKRKEIKELTKQLVLKIKEYVKLIVSGSIKTIKDTEELQKELLDTIIQNGASACQSTLLSFFTGKNQWECTEEEKNDVKDKCEKLKSQQILLILLATSFDLHIELVDYYGKYKKENAEKFLRTCRILEKYGWIYEEYEQQLLDGTLELYVKEDQTC